MTDEDWRRVRELFDLAAPLNEAGRRDLLDRECAGRPDVRAELEQLLSVGDSTGPLIPPVSASVVRQLARAAGIESTDQESDPLIGALLSDRFRVGERIGAGGFGVVYLAADGQLHDRPVVVKVLRVSRGDADWLKRHFEGEIGALSRIDHRGVVGVLHHGDTADGAPFVVMQYIRGESLRSALVKGPLRPELAGRIVEEACQALEAAHNAGVLHRDLKPENMILRDPGSGLLEPVIIDFGIAAVREHGSQAMAVTRHVAGSPSYMAPEQLQGFHNRASDVYAMALIAYEMLTGRRYAEPAMYSGGPASARQRMAALPSGLGRGVASVLARALSPEPGQRFQSAVEFGTAFRREIARSRRLPPALWIAAALLLLVATAAGWRLLRPAGSTGGGVSLALAIRRSELAGSPDAERVMPWSEAAQVRLGDCLRFEVTASRAGFLYLINEAGAGRNGRLFVLPASGSYPLPLLKDQPALTPERRVCFDDSSGRERFWLVWSARPLRQLDDLRRFSTRATHFALLEDGARLELSRFLEPYEAPGRLLTARQDGPRRLWQAEGDLLAAALDLHHAASAGGPEKGF